MSLLTRYIHYHILHAIGMVMLALLGLESFILLISQLGDLGNGDYGLNKAFVYVMLNLPQQLYQLFPMASLLGVLLGLGTLAHHSELMVIRAAGVSIAQITKTVMKLALLLGLGISLVGEVIAPQATRYANDYKEIATTNGQALNTLHGTWVKDQHSFIHIQTIAANRHLVGVSRYDFDDEQHLVAVSYAKSGDYQKPLWLMKAVWQTQLGKEHTTARYQAQQAWNLSLNPYVLKMSQIQPQMMNLEQLIRNIHYHAKNGLQANDYKLSFWRRLFQPLATLVMMFLGIPFIFGPLRSSTIGLKLLSGIIMGFGFYIVNEFFSPLSLVLQIPPLVAVILPSLIFASIGLWLMRRVN